MYCFPSGTNAELNTGSFQDKPILIDQNFKSGIKYM